MLTHLLRTASRRAEHPAVLGDDATLTYGELLGASESLARRLLAVHGPSADGGDLAGARVALLAEPGAGWVSALWGIWRAGGHAVPLALAHPEPELEHVLLDSGAGLVVAEAPLRSRVDGLAARLGVPLVDMPTDLPTCAAEAEPGAASPERDERRDEDDERFALLLYTSGTTGRPKGVPLRFRHLDAQIRSLSEAWRWTERDHVLGVLPLHHVHGLVNVVLSALWHGAAVTLHRRFDAERVWDAFGPADSAAGPGAPTLFMAVPTIYRRLLQAWDAAPARRAERRAAAERLRLMVSGSAALPASTLERWRRAGGHTLLERYGMTEVGMALSQPYDDRTVGRVPGTVGRVPGTVGTPLPGVEVRLVERSDAVAGDVGGAVAGHVAGHLAGEVAGDVAGSGPGDLEVRGTGVFDGYWNRPEDTAAAFTHDGFSRTGDVAVVERRNGGPEATGVYRLLGRRSVDLLKSGGEKISALEVEDVIRRHPAVGDVAVVGLDDPEWGQRVLAVVEVPPDDLSNDLPDELRSHCRQHLAAFKVPKDIHLVRELPRNALGKVVKPGLIDRLRGDAPFEDPLER